MIPDRNSHGVSNWKALVVPWDDIDHAFPFKVDENSFTAEIPGDPLRLFTEGNVVQAAAYALAKDCELKLGIPEFYSSEVAYITVIDVPKERGEDGYFITRNKV
jgi:hypothetical protein